jgi:AAA+ superfamily predicted ATPase
MSGLGDRFPDLGKGSSEEDEYLARAVRLLELAIRRRWSEGLLARDPDGALTAVLGAEQVERLMQPPPAVAQGFEVTDHRFAPESPLGRFVQRLSLSPTEADLVALLLAAETEPQVARLISYLGGNQASYLLTLDLLFEINYRPRYPYRRTAASQLAGDLAPQRPLRRFRFLLVDGTETRSALGQGVRLHPRITAWLLGNDALAAELSSRGQLRAPEPPSGTCDPSLAEAARAAFSVGGRLLLVDGPPRSGREMLLHHAAATLGRPLLLVSARGLTPDLVVAAFREAVLSGALLGFREAGDDLVGETRQAFLDCLEAFPGTVALVGAGASAPQLADLRPLTALRVEVPGHAERLTLWRTHLLDGAAALPEADLLDVAALYNLGVSGIVTASQLARERARFENRALLRADVAEAVRQLFESDLTAVATRVAVSQTWDDVVLSEDLGESVISILDRIRHRTKVLGNWGFARKVGKGLGVTVLFAGEPGTGKSMVAGLIARELGLDLYVVDLARVTSKWLGETEKNLARAFDAAEAGHVLLLFDEADTILGRRSEVRSANDRHANLETNFVLARLEQFAGIAFFTTNLASAIDPAVSRRMSAQLTFPFPDVEMRAELWRRMIPAETPLAGDIDFRALAARFELSGGFIRNVVLRAAFDAAQQGGALAMKHLERAAGAEYADRGSLLVGGRLV